MRVYSNIAQETSIPDELTAWDQWVCWRHQDGKKPPVDPQTGYSFDWTDYRRWHTFENAIAGMQEHSYDGVGFVLTPEDPFSIIDLDNVRDPKTGEIEPWAFEIVDSFDSFTEASPSGKGLHIIVRGQLPGVGRGKKPKELFVSSGYVTITGNTLPGYETIHDRQKELEQFYDVHIRRDMPVSEPPAPSIGSSTLSASEVLEKARNDRNGRVFIAMYDYGDTSSFGGDASRADYAVMRKLRYYTGGDTVQMERLFKDSALARREKMDGRIDDLTRRAMQAAMDKGGAVYDPDFKPMPVRDEIRRCLNHALFVHPWRKHAGRADAAATDYFGYKAMLRIAETANTLEVDMSERRYMEECGIDNYESALRSLARLQESGLLEKISDGGYAGAARYRIKSGSNGNHILIGDIDTPPVITTYDYELIPLKDTHLVRNPSPQMPDFDKNGRKIPAREAPLVTSVGKSAAMHLDIVHAAEQVLDTPVPLSFVAERLGISQKNLKARQIKKLLAAELLEECENGYRTPDDIQDRLQQELLMTGSHDAAKRRLARHDKDRRTQTIKQTIKRLAWKGKNRYEILHETGYDWEEIAALVPEVVDTYPVALEGHIDTLERQPVFHIVKGNVVYVVAPPSEMDTPGRHGIIFLDERRRIDLPGKVAA